MGDVSDDDEDRAPLIAEGFARRAERYAEVGRPDLAERLGVAGRYPPRLTHTPMIVDTDIGGDPDDAVALVVAALTVPDLALVLTCDEQAGQRARFARLLLDLCGRPEVPVVAGGSAPVPGAIVVDGLLPDAVPAQPDDLSVVVDLCRGVDGPVRWVGMGPLTNLATLVTRHPELVDQLDVTVMAGALNYRDPERAEHNVRLDVEAARTVLRTVRQQTLVLSDVTFTPLIEITQGSSLYRFLAGSSAPAWAQLLRDHLDVWFAQFHPGSMQHDALTLSLALQLPFVHVGLERVSMDERGRMALRDNGFEVLISHGVNYPAFMRWLERALTGSVTATVIPDRHVGAGPSPGATDTPSCGPRT